MRLWQQAAVAPGVVRFALERALAASPPFTGEAGHEDVSLSKEDQHEAQRLARLPVAQEEA